MDKFRNTMFNEKINLRMLTYVGKLQKKLGRDKQFSILLPKIGRKMGKMKCAYWQ